MPDRRGRYADFGRILARLGAVVGLALASPLFVLAALTVWASVGRPVMFRQIRGGQGLRPIRVCKFRTMREAPDPSGRLLPDDMRQTRATRLLRRLRIDELPQLLSIVRGEMAFVGPRPLLPETIAAFGELGRVRSLVPPGMTGWAQVNGNTHLSDEQKLALDVWYIRHRTLRLDLRIVARTLATLLFGERRDEPNIDRAVRDAVGPEGRDIPWAGS